MSNDNHRRRKQSKRLPFSQIVFGRSAVMKLHAALSRDLFDLSSLTCQYTEELDYDTIVSILPQRYRDITETIIQNDPDALLSRVSTWYEAPHPVTVWAKRAADGLRYLSTIRRQKDDPLIQKLDRDAAVAIRCMRQYFGFYSRLTVAFDLDDPHIREEIEAFEARVTQDVDVRLSPTFYILADQFWKGLKSSDFFSLSGLEDVNSEFYPQHGPGAVAEKGIENYQKGRVARESRPWILGRGIPLDAYALRRPMMVDFDTYNECSDPSFLWDEDEWKRCDECHPSRVILVPKDFRGPRFIAAEPCGLQYLQGGIDALLDVHIKHSFLRNVFKVHDQSYQRSAAMRASTDSSLCTIDMKDASDLVRVSHVRELCRGRPDIWYVLSRVRSGFATLPSGKVVKLTSYCTMGAKLCFKLEGIVFSLIDLAAIIDTDRDVRGWKWFTHFSNQFLEEEVNRSQLGVYGDDQLFRSIYYSPIVKALTEAGFTVNLSKCCHIGAFREACGVDAWNGHDVSVVRPRALPGAEAERQSLDGHVATIENLANHGYCRSAVTLWCLLASRHIVIPVVPSSSTTAGCVHSDILYELSDQDAVLAPSRYGAGAVGNWRVWAPIQSSDCIVPDELDEGAYWNALKPHNEAAERPRYPGRRVFIQRRLIEGTGPRPRVLSKALTSSIVS